MMASIRGRSCWTARTTEFGLPPTPIQVVGGASGVGKTDWFESGARVVPCQVTGPPASSAEKSPSFSSNRVSYWSRG